jgi:hypothetical protein
MMRPFTTGTGYINPIDLETDEGSDRIKAAFGVNYALKNKYDPTNLFRHNQNINPTASIDLSPRLSDDGSRLRPISGLNQ